MLTIAIVVLLVVGCCGDLGLRHAVNENLAGVEEERARPSDVMARSGGHSKLRDHPLGNLGVAVRLPGNYSVVSQKDTMMG